MFEKIIWLIGDAHAGRRKDEAKAFIVLSLIYIERRTWVIGHKIKHSVQNVGREIEVHATSVRPAAYYDLK